MSASAAARENNRQSEISRLRRAELQPIIDKLRQARDYFGVEENLVRDFSRSADQMAAQSAQTGMTNAGSGGLDRVRGDMLGSMLAALAQFKDQDDLQRKQLLAQLVGDPSLYNDAGGNQNVGNTTMWGALAGGAAGAGSALNAFLGTKEGMAALAGLFGGGDTDGPGISSDPYEDGFWNLLLGAQPAAGARGTTASGVPIPGPFTPGPPPFVLPSLNHRAAPAPAAHVPAPVGQPVPYYLPLRSYGGR